MRRHRIGLHEETTVGRTKINKEASHHKNERRLTNQRRHIFKDNVLEHGKVKSSERSRDCLHLTKVLTVSNSFAKYRRL